MKTAYPLVIIAAMLTLTGCAWRNNVSTSILNVYTTTKDEDVRERLLSYTPKGSDGTNVLTFVVDDLRPKSGCVTYFAYYEALKESRPDWKNKLIICGNEQPSGVVPMPSGWTPRWIETEIGTVPESDGAISDISARWTFDNNDKLIDVVVTRSGHGEGY